MADLQQFEPEDMEAVRQAYQAPDDPMSQQVIQTYTGLVTPKYTNDGQLISATHAPIDLNPPTKTESALRGAAQGATLGAQPIASAAGESAMGIGQSLLTGQNAFGDEGHFGGLANAVSNYGRARDTQVEQNEAAKKANPKTYIGSELAGGMVPALLTGGEAIASKGVGTAASTVAPAFQKAVNIAQLSGLAGLIAGFSSSKGDLTKGEVGQVAKDSIDSAIQAGSMGPLIGAVTQNLGGSGALQNAANEKAFQSTRPLGKQATTIINEGRAPEIGQTMLDQGIVGPLTTRSQMLQKTEDRLKDVGEQIGYYAKQADAAAGRDSSIGQVSIKNLASDIRNQIVEPLSSDPSTEAASNDVEKWVTNLLAKNGADGQLGFQKAQVMKGTLNKMKAKFGVGGDTISKDAFQQVYGILNNHIEDGINNAFQQAAPELENGFNQAKKIYGNLSAARDLLETSVAADKKNLPIGITDLLAGGVAATAGLAHSGDAISKVGEAALAGGAIAAHKTYRTFGNQALASFYNTLANLGKLPPESIQNFAEQNGPIIRESAARSMAAIVGQKGK